MLRAGAVVFVLALLVAPGEARAQTIGRCEFDVARFAFAGDARTQARCLLLIDPGVSDAVAAPALLARVGQPFSAGRVEVAAMLSARGLDQDLAASIDRPLSRAGTNSPDQPEAAYFVIHDTSYPRFGVDPFPADVDNDPYVNDLVRYARRNPVAHVFVNRAGEMFVGHDFDIAWRATKLEGGLGAGEITRGLFLHVELVQPRRIEVEPDGSKRVVAPTPSFTHAQYQRLAQLYVLASARAGHWLIPAFHAAVDAGLPDAHDDPATFDLAAFDAALNEIVAPPPGTAAAVSAFNR